MNILAHLPAKCMPYRAFGPTVKYQNAILQSRLDGEYTCVMSLTTQVRLHSTRFLPKLSQAIITVETENRSFDKENVLWKAREWWEDLP